MRSNHSNVIRFLLKRNFFLFVIVFLMAFSIFPFWGLSSIPDQKAIILKHTSPQAQTEELSRLVSSRVMRETMNLEQMVLCYGGIGFLCAVMLMRHLFSRRQGMLQAALPVKRETDFGRCCIAYLALCLAPLVMNFLLYLLVVGMNDLLGCVAWGELLPKFGMLLLINLYGFAMGMLSCTLTGTYWAAILAGAVLVVGLDGLVLLWHYLAGQYLHTMVDQSFREVWKTVSPSVSLYKGFYDPDHFAWLPGTASIAAALGASLVLCRSRKTEAAEHTLAFGWLHSVMGFVLPLIGGSLLGMVLQMAFHTETSMIMGIIVGAVFTFWVCRMVFNQRFCGILHQWYLPVAAAAVLVTCVAVLHTDMFGYDHFLPEREQLTAISYQPQSYHTDEEITLTSADALDAAYEWCTLMRDEADGYANGLGAELEGYSTVVVTYEVNGRKIYRQYPNMTARNAAQPALKAIIESDDYRQCLIRDFCRPTVESIYLSTRVEGMSGEELFEQFGVFPDYMNLTQEEESQAVNEWIKALEKDLLNRTFAEKQEDEIFTLQIYSLNPESDSYEYRSMPVYPGDEHVLKAIFGDQAENVAAYASGGYAASEDVVALKVTCSMSRAEMAADRIPERDVVESVTVASGPEEAEQWARSTRRGVSDSYYYMPDQEAESFSKLYLYRHSVLEHYHPMYQFEIPQDYVSFYAQSDLPATAIKNFIGE